MIRITDKTRCCGCTACVSSCPVQCISMEADEEGFDYPVVDSSVCIGCGRCEDVCPMLNAPASSAGTESYAVRNRSRLEVASSGGVFPTLADSVIGNGGLVAGASFDENLSIRHILVGEEKHLRNLFGSKYVQSDMGDIYARVAEALTGGMEVLFSGTPCQVAGLRNYLGKEYKGLITLDVACHGVPSPALWRMNLAAIAAEEKSDVVSVCFRDKSGSWKDYDVVYGTRCGKYRKIRHSEDLYMLLFLQNVSLRPSCYRCDFRSCGSCSDLTLGDLWNVRRVSPSMNDDRGASLVMVRSKKGRRIFEEVLGSDETIESQEVDHKEAISGNSGFMTEYDVPAGRADFFAGLGNADDLREYMRRYVTVKPWTEKIYSGLHSFLSAMKRRITR